jgi:hypothetical protein
MATRYWDRDTNGDWQTATNWSADTKPVANDVVIFDGRATLGPTEGMLDSESGATAECTYDLLHVKSTFTGDIGSSTEPCCCSPDKLIIEGSGTYHFLVGKDNQSTDTTIPITIINNKSATVYLYSNANDGANTCEFDKVYVIAGTVYLAYYDVDTDNTGCYVDELYIAPQNNKASYATVAIEKDAYKFNGTIPTDIYMGNGELRTDSMVGTFVVRGGIVYYGSERKTSTAVTETDMNITELRLYGGSFYWQPDDSGDPYIATAHLFGGSLDASHATSNDRAKVLGKDPGNDIYIYSGATLNIRNGMGNITIDTDSQLWNFGGTVTVDDYAQIAISYDQP